MAENPHGNGTEPYFSAVVSEFIFNPTPFFSLHATLSVQRETLSWNSSRFYGNLEDFGFNQTDDFTSKLTKASDVDANGVRTALALNTVVCLVLFTSYELLRRLIPAVYSGRFHWASSEERQGMPLPDAAVTFVPFDWVGPVFGVPWKKIRDAGGLDAYMFLRYIRMNLRITTVSSIWGLIILFPVFAFGGGVYKNDWYNFYHYSMANIDQGSWQIWVPSVFIYLFSFFVFFVMKQEYRHYIELRMDFLGKGDGSINTQQPYSLMVEQIPRDLRCDRALFNYFERLFPGKVHSACVVVNLPDLEALAKRKVRVTRRLEKSIACYEATGSRPTHVVGRPRMRCCGIESAPFEWPCCRCGEVNSMDEDGSRPKRGERVDSISYYTEDLATVNNDLFMLQRSKTRIVETGNASVHTDSWIQQVFNVADDAAGAIIDESMMANDLLVSGSSLSHISEESSHSRRGYGSFDAGNPLGDRSRMPGMMVEDSRKDLHLLSHEHLADGKSTDDPGHCRLLPCRKILKRKFLRRLAGRIGLDFAMSVFRYFNRRLNVVVDNVVGVTMSSTGFVTFLDHTSVTNASAAPLTHKPSALKVEMAPESRDIFWENAHIPQDTTRRREIIANVFLTLGAILWSIPLAAIQAFAKAEQLALIPGFEWILTFDGGSLKAFINGYMPVVALLCLILLLPILFEWVAVSCEHRKTRSEVQDSMVGRYFYYQVVNIYITVTAGSVWKALADVLDHPAEVLEILGESIPLMVGYFISFLVTKLLAGLPTVMLRVGALSRMLFLRTCFSEAKLTQRELDEVYRKENIQYGWEYPTQLLVIMICFAYACISPIILPLGALYFFGALVVYKKQVLYVYVPTYEGGGKLFPTACDRTLFGLMCGQLTFIGYTSIRQGHLQPLFLSPLPFITIYMMNYFRKTYAEPSMTLSLERAVELDHRSDMRSSRGGDIPVTPGAGSERLRSTFCEDAYRQPVLTEEPGRLLPYRREEMDNLTYEANEKLERAASRFQQKAHPAAGSVGCRSLRSYSEDGKESQSKREEKQA